MAYDAADGYVLLFGGGSPQQIFNDTWSFQNGSWKQLSALTAPPARSGGSMAYDSADGYVLLFGGQSGGYPYPVLNDTWSYVHGNWTREHPVHPPPARDGAGIANDVADGYVVLFGGTDGVNATFADTWEFHAGNWSNLTPRLGGGRSPSPRTDSLSYDAADQCVLLFSGNLGSLTDTWTYRGMNWTDLNLSPSASPQGVWNEPTAYDNADRAVVLLEPSGGARFGVPETWEFHNGTWRQVGVGPSPPIRQYASTAYDSRSGAVVLFGGSYTTQTFGDTWAFSHGNWTALPAFRASAATYPAPRFGAVVASDPGLDAVVMFGGVGPDGPVNDTWEFSNNSWQTVNTSTAPSARSNAAAAYDPLIGELVLFGGKDAAGTALGDTWGFRNGSWAKLPTGTGPAPPNRSSASMTYDPTDHYLLLFGGTGSSGYDRNDSWSYANHSWTALTPKASPPVREGAGLVFDRADGYLLLTGGFDPTVGDLNDSWTFSSGSWSVAPSPSSPPGRQWAAESEDPTSGGVLRFGGWNESSYFSYIDTWRYLGGNWSLMNLPTLPTWRYQSAMAPTGTDDTVILFGGLDWTEGIGGDTWLFGNLSVLSNASYGTPLAPVTPLHAAVEVGSTTVTLGGSVRFLANVTGGIEPYALQWDFGDGSMGSALPAKSVPHVYRSAGEYQPVLWVTDATGQKVTLCPAAITVSPTLPVPTHALGPKTFPPSTLLGLGALTAAGSAAVLGVVLLRRRRRWAEATALRRALEEGIDGREPGGEPVDSAG